MNTRRSEQHFIEHGNEFPFDAPRSWWESKEDDPPPPPKDWAHSAARGIIADLEDRRGIGQELEALLYDEEDDTRKDIVEAIAAIIRTSAPQS